MPKSLECSGGKPYVGRLAPAPTGALHVGNARTFLVAWLRARKSGGRLIMRLEDLDHPKVKPTAAGEAYRDLAWLGLDWDEGPAASFPPFASSAGAAEPFVQSNRTALYRNALERLRRHDRVYPCICTRKDLESLRSAPQDGEDGRELRYPGTCRGRFTTYGEAAAAAGGRIPGWRFRIDDAAESRFDDGFRGQQAARLAEWSGDFLLARGDDAGYQLAVVADDNAMGVTEVVRGDDLLPSTHRQLAVYAALGLEPPSFFHVPLVVGPDGRRLAKRHGDSRLSGPRLAGKTPNRLLGWLAWSCGWAEKGEELLLEEVARRADFSAIPQNQALLDRVALDWLGMGDS